jgi:hypothetical protein
VLCKLLLIAKYQDEPNRRRNDEHSKMIPAIWRVHQRTLTSQGETLASYTARRSLTVSIVNMGKLYPKPRISAE